MSKKKILEVHDEIEVRNTLIKIPVNIYVVCAIRIMKLSKELQPIRYMPVHSFISLEDAKLFAKSMYYAYGIFCKIEKVGFE